MLTSTVAGLSLTELNELQVIPRTWSPSRAVRILTPVSHWRMVRRRRSPISLGGATGAAGLGRSGAVKSGSAARFRLPAVYPRRRGGGARRSVAGALGQAHHAQQLDPRPLDVGAHLGLGPG